MKQKYFYGIEGLEVYYETKLEDCDIYIDDIEEENGYIEIVEMKPSKREGRFCTLNQEFEVECGRRVCDNYVPRNKINGRCISLEYGLVETGAKWHLFRDSTFKKISNRYKIN